MDQRTLIINGAIRLNGNTDILVEKLIEGASSVGIRIEQVNLREKRVGDCIACYRCMREATCTLNDDMGMIRDQIERIPLILLASPLYWCGVPGKMKTFIDRLFFYYHPQNRARIAGKNVIVLSPLNQNDVPHETAPLVEFFDRLFRCLDLNIAGMHFFGGIMEKGAVQKKPDYLDQVFSLGKGLHRLLK